MRKFMLGMFLMLLVPLTGNAATTEIPVQGAEKILISVTEAVINIQANPGLKTLKVSLVDGAQEDFQVSSQAGFIEIKNREPISKEDFGKFPAKKRTIEIQGPALMLEVHAFEGQVHLARWTKEALIHLQKGRIAVKDSVGTLKLHSQSGEISVADQSGKVQVDTYKSTVSIRGLNGDGEIQNFSGETLIERAKGALSLSQGQGSAKVLSSQGALEFELTKGIVQILRFGGRVEGQTSEGAVNIMMLPEGEVNVKSQSGKVTVQAEGGSGAALNLSSVEGDILVPNYLKVSRDSSHKFLQGRLKGDVQKGSITIRSQNGPIIIK